MPPPVVPGGRSVQTANARSAGGWRSLRWKWVVSVLSTKFRRKRFFIPAAIVLAALVAAGLYAGRQQAAPPELAFSEFLQRIDTGQVKQVRFADGAIAMGLADGTTALTVPPPSFLTA